MIERMKTALLAWCNAYQKGCEEQGPIMAFMKDYFLAAYQLTVGDRFFDTSVQLAQETTDGRTLGEACGKQQPLVEVKTINCAGAIGNWVYCPKCKDGQMWNGKYTCHCMKCGCDFCAVRIPVLAFRDLKKEERKDHRCASCRWFSKAIIEVDAIKRGHTYANIDGFCRRHAPMRVGVEGLIDLQWPNVKFRDWCGDWEGQLVTESHIYVKDGGVLGCSGTVREDGSVKTNKPA